MTTITPGSPANAPGAFHVPYTRARERTLAAAEAAELRAAENSPAVVAMRVERTARVFDLAVWIAVGLGLAYTMATVQHFAAAGAPDWSVPWVFAWVLDPIVSIVLVAILIAEQTISRHGGTIDVEARRAKWLALAATYALNTWAAWAALDAAGIFRHSVPPLAVFWTVNAAPGLRIKLMAIAGHLDPVPVSVEPVQATETVPPVEQPVAAETPTEESTEPARRPTVRPRPKPRPNTTGSDVSDLIDDAREITDQLAGSFSRDALLTNLRAKPYGHTVGGGRRDAIYRAMVDYRAGRPLRAVGGAN